MQKIVDVPVEDMEYYTFKKATVAGIENAIFSTTGYTGSGGCEIYVANEDGEKLWKAVMEAGKEFGIQAIGLGARDTLRLEVGFCLYGNDIDDEHTPIEAGLGWITKFVEGNDFIDREFFEKQKEEKPNRRLKGFEMIDRGIARKGYKIEDSEGNEIGEVTSGTMAPMVEKSIGMGYVKDGYYKEGTEIFIRIRNKALKAKIVKIPFYKA
jgi:aminomethyltransferase